VLGVGRRRWGAPRAPHTGPPMAAISAGSSPVCGSHLAFTKRRLLPRGAGLDQPWGERVSLRAWSSALRTSALTLALGFSW